MLNRITRALFLFATLLTASLLAYTLWRGQDGTVHLLSYTIKARHAVEKVSAALTPGRFRMMQVVLAVLVFAFLFLARFSGRISTAIAYVMGDTVSLFRDAWRTMISGPGKWLLLMPFAVTLYGLLFIPLNFDEALTYFDFTTRGPLVSLSYYPYPNNHVLHSLLTNFTRFLPFHALIDLRIMPVIITLLTNMLCLHLMTKLYGDRMAWVITGCFTVLFFSLYYGYMSRGYYLVALFFLISFYVAERMARGDASSIHRTAFVIASIAGFFTMPSYLYPFATLCLFTVLRRPASLRTVVSMGLVVVPVVVLLYLPIMVVNGVSALMSNPYVKPVGRDEVLRDLPQFLSSTLTEMTGFHWIWVLALLAIAFTHTVLFRQKQFLLNMIFFLVMPVLILLAHSVVPFPRTFSYYTLVLVVLTLLPYRDHLATIAPRSILVTLLIVQALCCWRFFDVIRPYEERDPQVNMTVWDINKNIMGDKRYFSAGTLMGTNLRFELETRYGLHDRITFRDLPVNADTLTGYDHIIVGRLLDSTRHRKPEYASPYFNVYGSKTEPASGLTK